MKICPKCAAENADTAKYCNECGTALEIKETKALETVKDTEPVSETPKEDVSPAENEEPSPVTVAETVSDNQESATEQTEKKEEQSPKKKNRLIIGIVAAALICIIGFMAARPRLKSLEVTYTGDTTEGVVLDDDNEGFKVTAVYSNGKKEDVPAGEWQIAEPQTLVVDGSCDIKIRYKNISQDITIECATSRISYITATYNGAAYDGTIINNKSDFTVTATCKNGYSLEINQWYLTPKEVTLKKDKTENIKLSADFNDNGETVTLSTVVSITGIENALESIDAEYKGSNYAGTVVDRKSDIEVEGKYADGKVRDIDKEDWSLDPESVTLQDGKKSKLKVVVKQDNGKTISTDLEIEGKEKPFTDPKVDGNHYNCTPDQFVNYLNLNSTLIVLPTDNNYFEGDDYSCYIITPPSSSDMEKTGLALRKDENGMMDTMIVIASDKSTGAAMSLYFAGIFDSSIDDDDRSKLAGLLLYKVYDANNTVVVMDDDSTRGNVFYIMTKDYFNNNFKQ